MSFLYGDHIWTFYFENGKEEVDLVSWESGGCGGDRRFFAREGGERGNDVEVDVKRGKSGNR
jgi:hypothetical protein